MVKEQVPSQTDGKGFSISSLSYPTIFYFHSRESHMSLTVYFPQTRLRSKFIMHVPCRLSKVMDAFLKGIFSSSPFPAPLLSTSAFSPPSLPDVLAGYNGTIFAYGQTSSGKTHTMEVRILTSMKGEEWEVMLGSQGISVREELGFQGCLFQR